MSLLDINNYFINKLSNIKGGGNYINIPDDIKECIIKYNIIHITDIMIYDIFMCDYLFCDVKLTLSFHLKTLTINNMTLNDISENIFQPLMNLEKISFTNIIFKNKTLPECLFNGNNKLKSIRISYTNCEILPPKLFYNQIKLKYLYLNNNKLNSLPATIFYGLFNLLVLDLKNNKDLDSSKYPNYIFKDLIKIDYINIEKKIIDEIHNNTLNNILPHFNSNLFNNLSN